MQVDIRKVAGTHLPLYEAWYHQMDPKNIGSIGALDAASFLKKSGLSSTILSKVWELSDPYGRGYLDKTGLFVALKLISLAQNGLEVSVTNVNLETPVPNMGELPPALPSVPVMPVSSALISPPVSTQVLDWTVKPDDAAKYNALFDSLDPVNETLPGNKVRGALLNSKLPVETLGKIWDLADIDKDGALDRHEFTVAMHLVYKVLDGYPLPATLPEPLATPKYTPSTSMTFGRKPSLAGAVPVLPSIPPLAAELKGPLQPPPIPVSPWVVSALDKAKYEAMFQVADVDKDGFVSGLEIKDAFLQSGLPQPVLAHIWNLCDMGQTGKLSVEQFALAMWLVQKKISGGELPTVLTPEMVPPSMRRTTEPVVKDESTNAELEEIAKEIEAMALEKRQLETEIAQKEADIKIKQGEVRTLQTEFETLSATLRQLENQKKEAQKRLDDLNNQVTTLRAQLAEQEKTLKTQEEEMAGKRQELNQLKQEETKIENDVTACKNSLESLNRNLQDTQLHISQVKAKLTVLEEQQRQMQDAILAFDSALEVEDASVASDYLNSTLSPTFQDPEFSRIETPTRSAPSLTNGTKSPFGETDPFSSHTAPARPPPPVNGDPFADSDFFSKVNTSRGTANDPFGAPADPFASAFGAPVPSKATNDPFAAFDSFGSASNPALMTGGSDPFGSDPFGASRAESPTPALPPKKAKQPPPRPAPPKSAGPKPQRPAPPMAKNDPFAAAPVPLAAPSAATSSDPFGGFADFANFDSKFSSTGDDGDAWSGLSSSSSSLSSSAWGGGGNSHSKKLKTPTFPTPVPTQAPPSSQTHRYAEFEFTEDPFKDVKFGDVDSDPFADAFAPSLPPVSSSDPFAPPTSSQNGKKEPSVKNNGWDAWNESSSVSNTTSSSAWDTDFPESDPFGAGTTEDSFASTKRSSKSSGFVSSTLKSKLGLKLPISPNKSKKIDHDENQLAWVAAESIREEEERIKRLELQEKADLELALALSQSEMEQKPTKGHLI